MSGYTESWFRTFADSISDAQTAQEIAFLRHWLPLPAFQRILDVGCGSGRHALELARSGYRVAAIDNSQFAILRARRRIGREAEVLMGDMRDLSSLARDFDGVCCLWATFGLFGDAENTNVLRGFADRLRHGGRLVLDIYDPAFFRAATRRELSRDGVIVIEDSFVRESRRHVLLTWPDGKTASFEWRLYSAQELAESMADFALVPCGAFAQFDPDLTANGSHPRMQLVFEKRSVRL